MSNYIVDGSDLTSVANAIRAKSGGSSSLSFPSGFVSEIGNISTGGGGYDLDDIVSGTAPTGAVAIGASLIRQYFFYQNTAITSVCAPSAGIGAEAFRECTYLQTAVIKNGVGANNRLVSAFRGCTSLTAVDLTAFTAYAASVFLNCTNLTTLILRGNTVHNLWAGVGIFNGTPFANGGSGGTIYIPKVLYDQLGTGTNDYKAATNWSTLDGYGTVTWAKIEGSQYENYYADGTAIA